MSLPIHRSLSPIAQVIVYRGHEKNPLLGPYHANIAKRTEMFEQLNDYRVANQQKPWSVSTVSGEDLVATLSSIDPEETLLVIPAGQSSTLDKVFDLVQLAFLENEFFGRGGRGYLTCGSAYWASRVRVYNDLCSEQEEHPQVIQKVSHIPLFKGIAQGPLCPFPGKKYKVGFFSDSVRVTNERSECTIYLSGGGSFIPDKGENIQVVARYPHDELKRLGISENEYGKWENAAIIVPVGDRPAVLMTMFHPYYGPQDIDVEAYTQAFPDCGTNWSKVHASLSPLDQRMQFVYSMLKHLEYMPP